MAKPPLPKLCVGVVTGAHGLGGAVHVKTFTDDPAGIGHLAGLEDEAGIPVALTMLRVQKRTVIAKLGGIADRTAAEAATGRRLFVSRASLPALERDEFYHADLLDLRVELGDGTSFGRVVAIHDFGAGDLVDVETDDGKSVVLPFTREVVPEVDIAAGRMVIAPPAGLIEGSDE